MSIERPRILVVDDEPTITNMISASLEDEGYSCICAGSGREALTKISTGNINVMLLDLRLPDMSGMDVLRQVASTYRMTTVIVVTAVEDTQTAVTALKSGAVDYIVKPFDIAKIYESIENALKRYSKGIGSVLNQPNEDVYSDEDHWQACIDSIARGVEVRLESFTGYTQSVIEETAAVARCLGIPEGEIDRWVEVRQKQNEERRHNIDSLIRKLEQNPIAQVVLGMTELHRYEPDQHRPAN